MLNENFSFVFRENVVWEFVKYDQWEVILCVKIGQKNIEYNFFTGSFIVKKTRLWMYYVGNCLDAWWIFQTLLPWKALDEKNFTRLVFSWAIIIIII